jgi:hypothetical protein
MPNFRPSLTCVAAMLVILAITLGPAALAGASAHGAPGAMRVKVSGLPRGVRGAVAIRGPHGFSRTVRRSVSLRGLHPGVYRVHIGVVRLRRPVGHIPKGSRAYPVRRALRLRVRAGRSTVARAAYGTIRSARAVALSSAPLDVVGAADRPEALVLSPAQASRVHVGSIVAAAPSRALPSGLFHRVTALARRSGRTRAALKPASLWEAFPSLDVDTTLPLAGSPRDLVRPARAAVSMSDLDLSVGADVIYGAIGLSCGVPAAGWRVAPFGKIRPSLTAELHRPLLGRPSGQLSVTVSGTAGLDVTVPKDAHCDISVHLLRAATFIPIFGVPVPVEGKFDYKTSLSNDSPLTARAQLSGSMTGGMRFDGGHAEAITDVSLSASGWVHAHEGRLSAGPEVQVGIGSLDVNGHISEQVPRVDLRFGREGCDVRLGGSLDVGLDAVLFHPSLNVLNPQIVLKRLTGSDCLLGPSSGGGAAGGGTSTGGTTPPSGNTPGGIVVGQSIAGIALGDSQARVRSVRGTPSSTGSNPNGDPQWYYLNASREVTGVTFFSGTVGHVYTTWRNMKTDRGIGPGSTLADLKRAYPTIGCTQSTQSYVCILHSTYGGKPVQTVFPFSANNPTQILPEVALQYGP